MSWDSQLEIASFRGVQFESQTIDDEIVRRLATCKYPYRDGADLEDMGREPRNTRITAVFFDDGDLTYESKLNALIQVIDEAKSGTFIHPILGEWQARIERSSIRHTHDERDMATVDLTIIEDGTDSTLPEIFTYTKLKKETLDEADYVDDENLTAIQEATDAASRARDFANSVANAVGDISDGLNKVRKYIDKAVAKARALTDIRNYKLVRRLKRLAYSCKKLAVQVRSLKPPLLKKRLAAAMPTRVLAQSLYGDSSRSAEIEKMNRVRNPFKVKRDTEMKVYGR